MTAEILAVTEHPVLRRMTNDDDVAPHDTRPPGTDGPARGTSAGEGLHGRRARPMPEPYPRNRNRRSGTADRPARAAPRP